TTPPTVPNEITSVNDALARVIAYGGKKLNAPELSPRANTCSSPGSAVADASQVISPLGSGLTMPEFDALADDTPVCSWQPVQPHACASVVHACAGTGAGATARAK